MKPFWQPEEQRKNVLGAEYERIVNEAVIVQIPQKEQETGVKVALVEGSYKNIKITTPEDLDIAEIFLKALKKMAGI